MTLTKFVALTLLSVGLAHTVSEIVRRRQDTGLPETRHESWTPAQPDDIRGGVAWS